MATSKPISSKITNIYLIGSAALLIFYSIVFNFVVLQTENNSSEKRLSLVAPFHFSQFSQGKTGIIKIDPLVNIYDQFELLPAMFQRRLRDDWQGSISFHFEDDTEFNIFAQNIITNNGNKIVYAVENIDAIEWDDNSFVLFEILFFVTGLILFLITAGFILKLAQRIGLPFENLAIQLEHDDGAQFSPIIIKGELSQELDKTLDSINLYRERISQAIEREQAFTRYVSHEFRTPMTVIRGCLSILRRQDDQSVIKQINRIDHAVAEMEQLTRTFLLIARDDGTAVPQHDINQDYLEHILNNLDKKIKANTVTFNYQLQQPFNLATQPQLLTAVIQNLCLNAINCSVGGEVSLFISPQRIDVVDNGVGLDAKPRGYEGFGIGLNLVRDICKKYQWQFSINNNPNQGCTASVIFSPD